MVNFNQFLKQAQSMQKKMQEMSEQRANTEYLGKAGGNLVEITMTGEGYARKCCIDISLLKESEKELLEDLIVAVINDAKSKIDQESQGSLSDVLNNMGLPPGLKMPF